MNDQNGNTQSVDMDRVMARVRKMLALANDAAASEGERDNALRMAHATLAKYNLSLAAAEAAGERQEEGRTRTSVLESGAVPWVVSIAGAISELFFCYYYISRGRNSKVQHYFIGRLSNVTTAQEMLLFVRASIKKEARLRAREMMESGGWERSFCKGAASRIRERCHQLRRDAEEASKAAPTMSSGTSLVLASHYDNEKRANLAKLAQDGLKLRFGGKSRERGADWGAFSSGRAFGDKVSLNRQIGGGSSFKALK